MEEDDIRSLVKRLARPHPSGGAVIERAALMAEGDGFAEVLRWIEANGGEPEAVKPAKSGARHGLHGARLSDTSAATEKPRRFVLPPGVLA